MRKRIEPLDKCLSLEATDVAELRARIKDYFEQTFDTYESLFTQLATADAWYQKPVGLRHPLIFYYGHTATFFINKMILARLVDKRIDPHLESILAVGVDEMSWDDLDDNDVAWPSIEKVQAYRDQVRAIVLDVIANQPLELPLDWDNPWWSLTMGIEHERIHLETSSVLIRQQKLEWLEPQEAWRAHVESGEAPVNSWVDVPKGNVELGRSRDEPLYGWDNEYGQHEAAIPAFKAARYLTSNQEFRKFVEAGGYTHADYWDDEGRAWLAYSHAEMPTFWLRRGSNFELRLMNEVVPMPWHYPVEVNAHEAHAFCAWKAEQSGQPVRLPSEDEYQRMLATSGWQPHDAANLCLDDGPQLSPVDKFPHGLFYDIVGNVWQWTQTPTYPFDGFEVHPYYDDFTTPTFDGRHAIIKGGSWISAGNEADPRSRYAFRRHFFQHAGFRYVASSHQPIRPSQYETDKLLSEYAEFHYGDTYLDVANFPKTLAQLAIKAYQEHHAGKNPEHALDLGCASGRASFELARACQRVTGVDFSARFIRQGVALADGEALRYRIVDEGDLSFDRAIRLADFGLAEVASRVAFYQGDACNLKPQLTAYDLVLAANLVDRLYEPAKFLDEVHARIVKGGLLMIATPCTWLTEHTPRAHWLGGFEHEGKQVRTLDGIKSHLAADFVMLGDSFNVPFVIRETSHKFQHSLSQVSLWRRL